MDERFAKRFFLRAPLLIPPFISKNAFADEVTDDGPLSPLSPSATTVGTFIQQYPEWLFALIILLLLMVVTSLRAATLSRRNLYLDRVIEGKNNAYKRIEQELLAKSEEITNILEGISEAYFSVDRDWHLTYLNPEAQRLLHRGGSKPIGEELWQIFPALSSFAHESFVRSFEEGVPFELTGFYAPTDKWYEFHTDPSGEGLNVYFRDVSARVYAADVLEESEQRLQAVVDNVLEGIITIDAQGVIKSFNRAAQNIFGYDAAEVIGKNVDMLMPASIRGEHLGYLQHYYSTGKSKIVGVGRELEGQNREGERFPIELAVSEIQLDGEPVFIGLVRDISERKEVEAENTRLAMAVTHAADAIFVTDRGGHIEYANPAYEKISGYSNSELIRRQPCIFQQASDDRTAYAAFWKQLDKGLPWSGQQLSERKDGSTFNEELALAPILGDKGRIDHFVGISRDISERLRQEQRLQYGEKMEAVASLANSVAHEFNNLLSGIIGHTEMTLETLDGESLETHNLKQVMSSANRGKMLVQQMLTFSQQDDETAQRFSPGLVVTDICALFKVLLPSSVEFSCQIANNIGQLEMVQSQFKQIVMNLGLNGIKAIGDVPGRFEIELTRVETDPNATNFTSKLVHGPHLYLQIKDSGRAIEPALEGEIFDPFATTRHAGRGRGMGLAAAHGIIVRSGGMIQVKSVPGEGTTFMVYLPLVLESGEH